MLPRVETTLTVRLPKAQRAALKRRAAAEKKSESALVRELIEREVSGGFDYEGVKHLAGSVRIDRQAIRKDAWATHIYKMNWRS